MRTYRKSLLLSVMAAGLIALSPMSMASAFIESGSFSSTAGTLVLKSPATLQGNMTCTLSLAGTVNSSGIAVITQVVGSGTAYCQALTPKGLPWSVSLNSASNASVTQVGLTLPPLIFGVPGADCGPSTISASWDNAAHVLSAQNQILANQCTVVSLSISFPTLNTKP
ncbi:alkane oxidation protein activator PraB [Pseudomonas lactucae]|uniref:Protein activator of alkane oxidation PraB n=1 Tax=Pseudomonas lactucae TaxID=2813360 RepID=A0A9X0Y9A1_9PSED|nr:alkane oxidation protein activator PraB [Pseudomonas lactucae]MBN2975330.1 hypothetical protein [Pseudomonas lactucae]MBN2987096.1 hypothetical protein [Pseudomonas lactucae]